MPFPATYKTHVLRACQQRVGLFTNITAGYPAGDLEPTNGFGLFNRFLSVSPGKLEGFLRKYSLLLSKISP